jgi:hypothetical protein
VELVGVGLDVLGFAGAADGAILDGEPASIGLDADALLVHVGKPPLLNLADDRMVLQILYQIITWRSFVAQYIAGRRGVEKG